MDLRLVAWDTGWAAMKALLQEVDRRMRTSPGHGVRRVRLFLGATDMAGLTTPSTWPGWNAAARGRRWCR
ncbi:hypothetical protein ACW23B_01345 [Streptomyces albidoflavus]